MAPPSNAAAKMAMVFSTLAVAVVAANGMGAGVCVVVDEHGAEAGLGLGVLATSEGAEAGGDATGDSVAARLGGAVTFVPAGEGAFVSARSGVAAMTAFVPARSGVAAMGTSAGEGVSAGERDFAIEVELINPKAKTKMRIAFNRAILFAGCCLGRYRICRQEGPGKDMNKGKHE